MDRKKVLFAYDGSACANEALEDLSRAGLPAELDLLVVSVAEVWVLPADDDADDADGAIDSETAVTHGVAVSKHAREGLDRARIFAEHAANRIRERFPAWSVDVRVYPDSPAWGVLQAAEKFDPDMIILGSHGRSVLGRFFLGSVSQKVLSEARCSVRIARHRDTVLGAPVRLLIGVDGTPDSVAAVEEIASRSWPAGSSVKVLAAIGPISVFIDPTFAYDTTQWSEVEDATAKQWERMEKVTTDATATLRAAGLLAESAIREGGAVALLLEEAREVGADCIVLGARGHRFMERFLLGSVSSAIASRAACSVEIIRTAKDAE
jgi:nucleotide-binding universal stress UspA family protein